MSGRLAFQSQLASIMEVLANAAVAEICRLVEDEYAVVQLQMSQCQRENKALKRKLHLLEIKMARGNAERRLRDSAMHSSRPRLQVPGIDRLRGTGAGAATTCTDGTFGTQMDLIQWSGRGSAGDTDQMQSDSTYSKSPDVQLVEPQAAKVKEEQVEANTSRVKETQEDLEIIRDDGVVERVLSAPPGPRPSLEQQETQCLPGQNQHLNQEQSVRRTRASSRGVEVSDSSPLLNCELLASVAGRNAPQVATAASDSLFAASGDGDKGSQVLVEEFYDQQLQAEAEAQRPSCSFLTAAADFTATSSSVNGWARYGFPQSQSVSKHSTVNPRTGAKERLFVCSYCGKAFNRPKKVEIHQRVHTGEKPFSCSTCGKTFSEAGNLRKHQRVHSGEKPYSCGLCGRGFAWIRNLKTHQQKSHPEVYSEDTPELSTHT